MKGKWLELSSLYRRHLAQSSCTAIPLSLSLHLETSRTSVQAPYLEEKMVTTELNKPHWCFRIFLFTYWENIFLALKDFEVIQWDTQNAFQMYDKFSILFEWNFWLFCTKQWFWVIISDRQWEFCDLALSSIKKKEESGYIALRNGWTYRAWIVFLYHNVVIAPWQRILMTVTSISFHT